MREKSMLKLDNLYIFNVSEHDKVEINHTNYGCNETESCTSDFIIDKTSYNQTGLFTCHYNDSITFENFDSAYIFFNDPSHLSVPVTENVVIDIIAKKLSPLTIPCIPTSSKVEVTLWKMYTGSISNPMVAQEQIQVNPIENVSYDPKHGFHFKYVLFDETYGLLACKFSLENHTEEVKVAVYLSHQPDADSIPTIDSYLAKRVVIHGRFTLTCKLQLVHDEDEVDFTWEYPKADDSIVKLGEIKLKHKRLDHYNVTFVSRSISVSKVKTENEGWYTCVVKDKRKKEHKISKYITVYESTSKPFIELSNALKSNTLKKSSGANIKLRVYINAFPKVDFDGIYWLKDGIVMDTLNSEHFESKFTENEATLEIKNATAEDIGFYTLKVSS
ncbi:Vascular endothelial growth factor receptor 3-like protein, partial [Dinothrombium tinctorium]